MPAPRARKSPPPPPPKKRAAAKPKSCAACGAKTGTGHVAGCPNASCDECGMMGGNHEMDCSSHPNYVVDGTTGEVRTDTVDGQDAKIDARPADPRIPIQVDTESLLIELAEKERVVKLRKSERGRASNALKQAIEARDAVIGVLAQRGLDLREPKLPGVEAADDVPFDDDDESDVDDEGDE